MKSFTVNSNDAGQRLDKFVLKSTCSMATSLVYKFLRTKRIKVNRKKCDASYRLAEGDVVEMYIPDEFFAAPEQSFLYIEPKIDIVFEDDNILLVNKPIGVICQPDDSNETNTLIDHVKAYLYKKGDYKPDAEATFAPALCNRIDRNTAGIVICAKNAEALRTVNQMIKERKIKKRYIALIHGRPPKDSGVLKHFLKKDAAENKVAVFPSPVKGALTAVTEYTLIKYDRERDESLVELELHTGRTHQIRAQMSYIGNPLVGDGKYGSNREDKRRGFGCQALFSRSVEFLPDDGSPLEYLKGKIFFAKPDGRFDSWLT